MIISHILIIFKLSIYFQIIIQTTRSTIMHVKYLVFLVYFIVLKRFIFCGTRAHFDVRYILRLLMLFITYLSRIWVTIITYSYIYYVIYFMILLFKSVLFSIKWFRATTTIFCILYYFLYFVFVFFNLGH